MVGVSRLVIMVGGQGWERGQGLGRVKVGGQGFLGQCRGQGCVQGQGLCVKVRVMIGGHKVGVKVEGQGRGQGRGQGQGV